MKYPAFMRIEGGIVTKQNVQTIKKIATLVSIPIEELVK